MNRIGLLGQELLLLISKGKKETLTNVQSKARDGKLVSYLLNKYNDMGDLFLNNPVIEISDWEKKFNNHFIDDDKIIKHKCFDEDDGLLLVVFYIFTILCEK